MGYVLGLGFLVTINILSYLFYSNKSFENSTLSVPSEQFENSDSIMRYSLRSLNDSTTFDLETSNKIIILDFWFVNCQPCRSLMPHFKELAESYNYDKNIVFLSLNDGSIDSYSKASQLINSLYTDKKPFYYDEKGNFTKFLGVTGHPQIMIINKKGKIAYRRRGFSIDDSSVFVKRMQDIIDEIKNK